MGFSTEILKSTLLECEKKLLEMPNFQQLHSIKAQINYLIDLIENRTSDRSRLKEIIIGVYAAREFETRDMEFANRLYQVEDLVAQIKKS